MIQAWHAEEMRVEMVCVSGGTSAEQALEVARFAQANPGWTLTGLATMMGEGGELSTNVFFEDWSMGETPSFVEPPRIEQGRILRIEEGPASWNVLRNNAVIASFSRQALGDAMARAVAIAFAEEMAR